MDEQDLIDMYSTGCVIEANEHLQYSPPPSDFCDNLPKVIMVGTNLAGERIIQELEKLQDEGKLGIVCWEQEATEVIEEEIIAICPTGHESFHKELLTLSDKYINLKDVQPEQKQLNTKNTKHPKPWYVGGRY